jgi:hypothetical protein
MLQQANRSQITFLVAPHNESVFFEVSVVWRKRLIEEGQQLWTLVLVAEAYVQVKWRK